MNEYLEASERVEVIRSYALASGLKTFVETGTAGGDTTAALIDEFNRLYTIEVGEAAYEAACQRFADEPKVHCILGDSAKVLVDLCPTIDTAVYWLDGHFCSGPKGEKECPLLEELAAITAAGRHNVILIDDARLLGADPVPPHTERWPSLDNVLAALIEYQVEVADDIVRAVWDSSASASARRSGIVTLV